MRVIARLARILNCPSREELSGASLTDTQALQVPPTRDAARFLRGLPVLFPDGAIVYFEGTTERPFAAWLSAHAVTPGLKIGAGTIWPRPDTYHVPLEAALLNEASSVVEREGISLPSIHVHVHDGTRVLLEWHDAFISDPMYIHSDVPQDRIEAFCRTIGVSTSDIGRRNAT